MIRPTRFARRRVRRSPNEVDRLAQNRAEVDKILEETRARGYASAVHSRRVSDEITIAVPVMLEDRVLAAVVIRFAEKAVPLKLAIERFVPQLHDTARRIYETFTEQQRNPPYQHSRAASMR